MPTSPPQAAPRRGRGARILDALEAGLRALIEAASRGSIARTLIVGLVALAVVLPGLAALPVTDRDEARFAQATKQMLETGDLVDIRFQDDPRWKKPVGIYWLQAAVASAAGGKDAPIWAYRLPSAIGIVLAAIGLAWAARPLVGPRGAALAGLMLPATVLAAAEANIAKTDAMLLATAVAALAGLARLIGPERPALAVAALFWTALAAAVLLKGPIVPLIAVLALAALWGLTRRLPEIRRLRPMPGLVWTALLCLPWFVAIWTVSEGRFFAESVGRDLLGKVAEGQEKHWGPPGLYLVLIWGTFWPWAAFLPVAASWLWARRREPWLLLLAAWVVPFWVILEAVPTKLPHYVLPLYPALAVALAAWLLADDAGPPSRRIRLASALLVAIPGVGLALALLVLPVALEGSLPPLAVPLALGGGAAALLAALAALRGRRLAQAGAGLVALVLVAGGILQVGLPSLATVFPSPRIAALAEPWRACGDGPLVTAGYREPSMVFHAGTETRLATPPEAARILAREPGALVLLERRWLVLMDPYWPDGRPELVTRATLRYFNYNRGDFEIADLVTRPDPRWELCAG
ncbi:MAG: ArnT family glycosyltransferase [Paracoccaceae bacterium]